MYLERFKLENKIAVVTGAGRMRSIGRSIALELARAGCDVVIIDTPPACSTETPAAAIDATLRL